MNKKNYINQMTLFDINEIPKKKFVESDNEYSYIIYIATEKGNCTGIIYECKTIEACQEFCSRDETKGNYMGVKWAYFFTKKSNIEKYANDTYSNFVEGMKNYDRECDSRFDEEYLDSLGIRKIQGKKKEDNN